MSEARQTPGLPEDAIDFTFAGWDGIDTKPSRSGVDDKHSFWSLNLMPLGENNIRALPDRTPATLYTAPSGLVIVWHGWFVLTATGLCAIVSLSDGSLVQVARFTGVVTPIAPAGTIAPAVNTLPYAFQFGSNYLVIVSEQSNGYWLWDGVNLYGAGTLAPIVNITSGGQGYTSVPPGVTLFVGSSGTGTQLQAVINNGSVTQVIVNNPGHSFILNEQPIITFSGGGGGDTAYGIGNISNGVITSTAIDQGGSGYTSVPAVNISDSTGSGGSIVVNGISGGIITSLKVVAGGINYTAPTLAFSGGGGGANAAARAFTTNGVVTSVTMQLNGSLYGGVPTAQFVQATAAAPGTGAAGTAIVGPGGTITGVNLTSGGSGYTGGLYVTFTGGQGPAAATVQLMPFGIQGSTGDVNGGRIWVASVISPVKVFFSAPGTQAPQDFLPSDGAGAFPPNDSHLQYQYTALKSSGGEFLYLIGDSSVDYESGAQTTGSPSVTTFAKLNVDEQIGTVWRDSVVNFGRAIVFANTFGVHTIYGGAVTKISPPLDGVYTTALDTISSILPSSAVAEIFGIHVYMLLLPIIDPITGALSRTLFMWDGKRWWPGNQSADLRQISTSEYASDIRAWGSDGTSIFQLFTTPGTTTKTLLTKLWTKPSILMEKKAAMFYAQFKAPAGGAAALTFAVDTGRTSMAITQGSFTTPGGGDGDFARSRTPPLVGQALGYRMTSTSGDFTIINLLMLGQEYKKLY